VVASSPFAACQAQDHLAEALSRAAQGGRRLRSYAASQIFRSPLALHLARWGRTRAAASRQWRQRRLVDGDARALPLAPLRAPRLGIWVRRKRDDRALIETAYRRARRHSEVDGMLLPWRPCDPSAQPLPFVRVYRQKPWRRVVSNSIEAGERIGMTRGAHPRDNVAIIVVVRRLDQKQRKASAGGDIRHSGSRRDYCPPNLVLRWPLSRPTLQSEPYVGAECRLLIG
jgi:hypothetical protein